MKVVITIKEIVTSRAQISVDPININSWKEVQKEIVEDEN